MNSIILNSIAFFKRSFKITKLINELLSKVDAKNILLQHVAIGQLATALKMKMKMLLVHYFVIYHEILI